MKMHAFILISLLLVCSVWANHWEINEVDDTAEDQLEEPGIEVGTGFPGVCWACKWVIKKVKKNISNSADKEEVKQKLMGMCDQIGFLRSVCKKFVARFGGILVEELSTSDDPKTICANVGICKARSMLEYM